MELTKEGQCKGPRYLDERMREVTMLISEIWLLPVGERGQHIVGDDTGGTRWFAADWGQERTEHVHLRMIRGKGKKESSQSFSGRSTREPHGEECGSAFEELLKRL